MVFVSMVAFVWKANLVSVVDVVNGLVKIVQNVCDQNLNRSSIFMIFFFDLGPCSGNYSCLNHGTCTNSTARICQCPSGFTGPYCAEQISHQA